MPRHPETWVNLGYSEADAETFEDMVQELHLAHGGLESAPMIRRAIAAVTFQPTSAEKGLLAGLRLQRRLRKTIRRRIAG